MCLCEHNVKTEHSRYLPTALKLHEPICSWRIATKVPARSETTRLEMLTRSCQLPVLSAGLLLSRSEEVDMGVWDELKSPCRNETVGLLSRSTMLG
jgi:hypothetical protein